MILPAPRNNAKSVKPTASNCLLDKLLLVMMKPPDEEKKGTEFLNNLEKTQ